MPVGRIEALGGLLKRIGNFDPVGFRSDFKDRLILQKTIYLMQQFGLNIGYFYNWYIRGPYSPALTRDAYQVAKRFKDLPPVRFASPQAEKRFKEFLMFIEPKSTSHIFLEKIASIHFLVRMYPSLPKGSMYTKTKAKIPSLTREEFEEMYQVLTRFGLFKKVSIG